MKICFNDDSECHATFQFPFEKPFTGNIGQDIVRANEGVFDISDLSAEKKEIVQDLAHAKLTLTLNNIREECIRYHFPLPLSPLIKTKEDVIHAIESLVSTIPSHHPWSDDRNIGAFSDNGLFCWRKAHFGEVYNMQVGAICLWICILKL
jgi:hypothetical protein